MPSRTERSKRRAASYGYSGEHFTLEEWEALLELFGRRCLRCGVAGPLSVDHITPLCLGGSNTIENIQPLCVACNSLKGDAIVDYRPLEASSWWPKVKPVLEGFLRRDRSTWRSTYSR
jgi:5-methylcytosine-specific restriction endonuclease McrA